MKNKIVFIAMVLMMIFSALLPAIGNVKATGDIASFTKIYLHPSVYTATSSGDIFTVEVNIANVSNLFGLEFKLGYDTTILDALEVVEGSFLGSFGATIPFKLEINETSGFIWVAIVLLGPTPAEGDGTLATVSFECTGIGEYVFDLYDTKLVDAEVLPIAHHVTDGYSADDEADPPPPVTPAQAESASVHDVAVTGVTPSGTLVNQGDSLPINVVVENQGDSAETFDVTVYYGTATITPEQWEAFWSIGDVNRDGTIKMADAELMMAAFGSTPGDPNWNPDADIARYWPSENIIDVLDAIILSTHYCLDIWTYFSLSGDLIGTQTITLASGASTTLTFTWATGVTLGTYVISAYAPPVSGEIDKADNNFGDGVVTIRIAPDTVDIDPDILNLKNSGEWVTAYIELPSKDVGDIDLLTVQVEGISAITDPQYGFVTDPASYLMDHDGDGILERMVKFNRDVVRETLTDMIDLEEGVKFYDLTLTVTGQVAGTPFEVSDTIIVIQK